MKVKDLIGIWDGWDSQDVFTVREGAIANTKTERKTTGKELENGPLSERTVLCFGSYSKQPDGTWRHYIVIEPETISVNDLKELIFNRANWEEAELAHMEDRSGIYDLEDIRQQRHRFRAVFEIISEARLISEYDSWKSNAK